MGSYHFLPYQKTKKKELRWDRQLSINNIFNNADYNDDGDSVFLNFHVVVPAKGAINEFI